MVTSCSRSNTISQKFDASTTSRARKSNKSEMILIQGGKGTRTIFSLQGGGFGGGRAFIVSNMLSSVLPRSVLRGVSSTSIVAIVIVHEIRDNLQVALQQMKSAVTFALNFSSNKISYIIHYTHESTLPGQTVQLFVVVIIRRSGI